MQTIIRPKFSDTPLDDALLECAASVWLHWHRNARERRLFPRRIYHRVQAQLWGIPRPEIEACRKQFATRAAREIPNSSTELSDAETLTITGPWSEISQPSGLARLAGLFANSEFEGMRLTLRLTAGDWRDVPEGRPTAEGTLVIWGELRSGVPRLKALWPGDLSGRGETPFRFAACRGESDFWKAVEQFRNSGEVPPGSEIMFATPVRQQLRHAWHWLIFDVGEQRTLPAFLGRVTFFAVAAVVCLAAADASDSLFLGVLSVLPLSGLTFIVVKKARNIATCYGKMSAAMKRLYSQPQKFVPVDIASFGPQPEASAHKFTRELESLGLSPCGDVQSAAHNRSYVSCQRLFMSSTEPIYVFLNLLQGGQNFQYFPVKGWFVSFTYFSDGTRLLVTSEGGGYRKSRDPLAIQRFYPEVEDPAVLLELHRATMRTLIAEGNELARSMTPDELLARMEFDANRVGELTRRAGYFTWGAAIRQSFKLVRAEYRVRP